MGRSGAGLGWIAVIVGVGALVGGCVGVGLGHAVISDVATGPSLGVEAMRWFFFGGAGIVFGAVGSLAVVGVVWLLGRGGRRPRR